MEMRASRCWSIAMVIALFGCAEEATDAEEAGNDDRGCDQECRDSTAGTEVADGFQDVWSRYIAGTPAGFVDRTVNCAFGGTDHFYGTTSASDNGINTMHLTHDMAGCAHSQGGITYTGIVTQDGSFDSSHLNVAYGSAALRVAGTVDGELFDETCPFSMTEEYDSSSYSASGLLCGRSFSDSY